MNRLLYRCGRNNMIITHSILIFDHFWIPKCWIRILYNNYQKMNRVAITCSSLSIILMIHLKPSNWCCCCYLHSILLNVMHHIIIIIIILSFVRGYKACAKQVFSVMMPSFLPLHSSINFVKPMLVPISIKSKMIRRRHV